MSSSFTPNRRAFLASSVGSAAVLATSASTAETNVAEKDPSGRSYTYEITRSDEEWRAQLSREEYVILRKGSTELPHTSPLVDETREGVYRCKGCDLDAFDSVWKKPLDIGYVFFRQSVTDAVLTSPDGLPSYGKNNAGIEALLEVHCRRCSSHLGHIVSIDDSVLYCINGAALNFEAVAA